MALIFIADDTKIFTELSPRPLWLVCTAGEAIPGDSLIVFTISSFKLY